MGRKVIRTSNKEIYEKFNLLNFSSSVELNTATKQDLTKLMKNINKTEKILSSEKHDSGYTIRKHKPMNISIYMSGRKNNWM